MARNKIQRRSERDGGELVQLPVRPDAQLLEVVNVNTDLGRRVSPKT